MNAPKKLIEVALPLGPINEAGYREQTIKRGKPTQMHKWFAARPMSIARAVLWASLVDDPSNDESLSLQQQADERERLFQILKDLVKWENTNNESVIQVARDEINRCFPDGVPPLLDPFGGGGAIPLEAQRLGLAAITGDLNPVPVLIQRALLVLPHSFDSTKPVNPSIRGLREMLSRPESLAADIRAYGASLSQTVETQIQSEYQEDSIELPSGAFPIAWIWARTVKSPDPSWAAHVPLVSTWWLSKKSKTWIEPLVDEKTRSISFRIQTGGEPTIPPTISRAIGTCLATGSTIPAKYIKEQGEARQFGTTLLAVVAKSPTTRGRIYLAPRVSSVVIEADEEADWFPQAPMSNHSQYMGPPKYGIREWSRLFNRRQLLALRAYSDGLQHMQEQIQRDALDAGFSSDLTPLHQGGVGAFAYSEAILTYLAFAINRLADWNNTSCGWDSTNAVNQHLFTRQAIPMMWDHCEIRPFDEAAGSFTSSLDTIATAVESLKSISNDQTARVSQMDCRAHVARNEGAFISTDPPYYDAVPYSDIADFFHVLFRLNLSKVWPNETATISTPKSEELVADSQRFGSKMGAAQHFESGMSEFMSTIRASHHSSVPSTIYYAYKSTEDSSGNVQDTGWSTFLQAIVDAGLVATATWPLRTENPSRLRAIGSNALSSTVVLVCRPREVLAQMATRAEFVQALRAELPEAVRVMQSGNIAPVDIPQATIGPGVGLFSRFAKVVESDGTTMPVYVALAIINEVLSEILDGEESEMDADSRFALTWYSQFGFDSAASGDADALARAKNTSLHGVVEAGIGDAKSGRFRLFHRSELAPGWSPLLDKRPTVWEATQHLIDALERSESEAAELLRQLGGYAERARVLAYLLFKKATDKGWSEEAGAYNGLIVAWPALQVASVPTTQQTMELG